MSTSGIFALDPVVVKNKTCLARKRCPDLCNASSQRSNQNQIKPYFYYDETKKRFFNSQTVSA